MFYNDINNNYNISPTIFERLILDCTTSKELRYTDAHLDGTEGDQIIPPNLDTLHHIVLLGLLTREHYLSDGTEHIRLNPLVIIMLISLFSLLNDCWFVGFLFALVNGLCFYRLVYIKE